MFKDIYKYIFKTRTLLLWAVQFPLMLIAAYGINVISNADNSKESRILWFFVIVVLGIVALIILSVSKWRDEKLRLENSRMSWLHHLSSSKLNEQLSLNDQFYKNKNYFKLLLANFRARAEARKYNEIAIAHNHFWIMKSLAMWDYFIYIFRALMNQLIEKDEYLTLSIVEFWSKDKDSEQITQEHGNITQLEAQNFFETNFRKCLNGNVKSKRIIIVNLDRLRIGRSMIDKAEKNEEVRYYQDFLTILNNYVDAEYQNENFYNRFYLTNDKDYKEITKEAIPFALVRREGYDNKLCVTTYIPGLHSEEKNDKILSWRTGSIPKVGLHICADETDHIWQDLYGKFHNLYDDDLRKRTYSGKYMTAKQVLTELDSLVA